MNAQVTHTPGQFPYRYKVMAIHRGKPMQIGTVSYNTSAKGWRFFPIFQANPSRKLWDSAHAAVRGRVKNFTLEAV